MATNRALKEELLSRLGIQAPALSKRVQKKIRALPMSTEEATYLIAHEAGVRIDRYLSSEEVIRIRELHTQSRELAPTEMVEKRSKKVPKQSVREIRFPQGFKASDPLLSERKLAEAISMASVYPLLYVLENSMREVVKRVMQAACGEDWWDHELDKGKLKNLRQKVADRMLAEKRRSWHQRRGDHPIDYTDITDLESLILAKQARFVPDIIPDRAWFQQFMKELYPSRNVVCHMNPLDPDNMADVRLRVKKWTKMIENARDAIPE